MTFRKALFKNILISGGYNYLSQLLSFFSSLVTARLLLPENYGLVGLITVFSGFIAIFSDSGLSMAVIRSGYGSMYHRALNLISIIIGLVLCGITLLLIYPISLFYHNEQLILPGIAIAFLFVIRSMSIVPLALIKKKLDFAYVGKNTLIGTLGGIIVTIVLAWFNFAHWALIFGQYATALITWMMVTYRVHLPIQMSRPAILKKSFSITRSLIGSLMGFNIVNYWSRNADNLLVGKLYGISLLGIYNRAYTLLTLPMGLITGVFSSVLYPSLVQLKKEGGDVQREYYFVLKVISIINMPVAFLLILFPYPFVTVLWGEQWTGVAVILPYFGLLIMTQTLLSTVGSILVLEKKEKRMMFSGWVSAVFMLTGIILGAAISFESVAAFYAIFYIVGVLGFNMIYVYYKTLAHSLVMMLKFWMPKIILSVIIWCGIYFNYPWLVYSGVGAWVMMIVIDTRSELKTFLSMLYGKIR